MRTKNNTLTFSYSPLNNLRDQFERIVPKYIIFAKEKFLAKFGRGGAIRSINSGEIIHRVVKHHMIVWRTWHRNINLGDERVTGCWRGETCIGKEILFHSRMALTTNTNVGISEGEVVPPFLDKASRSRLIASCTRSFGCEHIPVIMGMSVSTISAAKRRKRLGPEISFVLSDL
jgi:hypothetical protein